MIRIYKNVGLNVYWWVGSPKGSGKRRKGRRGGLVSEWTVMKGAG